MELVEFIRLVHIQIWPCDRRAQYRNNGDCLSSPHLEAVQLSFSLYVSGASDTLSLWHCPFTGAQSEYLQARVFVWALKRTPVFPVAFHLTWMDRSLLVFTARYFVGSSSQYKAETLTPKGGTLKLRYPSPFLTTTHGFGSSPFCISTLPTSLNMAFFFLYF